MGEKLLDDDIYLFLRCVGQTLGTLHMEKKSGQ